jgi:LPXTG-motif cell wall-anchored protein
MMRRSGGPNWTLALEVGLLLLLIGLALGLYVRPAARGTLDSSWWLLLLMGGLFFGVVALWTRRRRRRSHAALHRAIREEGEAPT